MVAFVASQLGIAPALFADYAQRDETRREHVGELQGYLRLRSFRLADWRACLQAGTGAARATAGRLTGHGRRDRIVSRIARPNRTQRSARLCRTATRAPIRNFESGSTISA